MLSRERFPKAHIAISKSFGRINNYTINPSQELVAIGFTNVFGPFLGAYPATGSFSRTAIKSKAGVRTPLAGVFTAIVVLLALYALTAVFFFIPMSSLSAVIIHAVGDLITPPNVVFQFWEGPQQQRRLRSSTTASVKKLKGY